MNESIIYAGVALVCYGLTDFVFKRGSAAVRPDHFLMAQGWIFFPSVTLYAILGGRLAIAPAALWGSVAGAFAFIGLYFFIRSLAAGSVSTNASIFRLNFIVTVALVVALLGEPLTAGKIAGIAAALAAIWLLLAGGAAAQGALGEAQRRSLVYVAVATLAFGASNFFHALGLRHGAVPETMAVAQAALFTPLATAVVYIADRKVRPPAVTYRYAAGSAALLFGATIALLHGIAAGQASIVIPIAQMGFIVTVLLGVIMLGERLTPRKIAGFACALAALVALAAAA